MFDVGKAQPIIEAVPNSKISVEGHVLQFG